MPRKRTKTDADRPAYRAPTPSPVPEELQGYADGAHLRRLVERYGVDKIQAILEVLAERNRREMVERRAQEIRDAWKSNVRPLAGPVKIPASAIRSARESRRAPGYRGHLEEHLDRTIRKQARARELEIGLAAIVERGGIEEWEKRDLAEIVDRAKSGQTVNQIALALGVSNRTIERRLEDLRSAVRKVN